MGVNDRLVKLLIVIFLLCGLAIIALAFASLARAEESYRIVPWDHWGELGDGSYWVEADQQLIVVPQGTVMRQKSIYAWTAILTYNGSDASWVGFFLMRR